MSEKEGAVELLARGVLVANEQLLLCHGKGKPISYRPGGHIEAGESARTALAREMLEEAGLTVKVGRFLGVVEHQFVQKGRSISEINLVFEMTAAGAKPPNAPSSLEDYIEFEWTPMKSLSSSRLEPASVRNVLGGWLQEKTGSDRLVERG